MSFRAMSGLIQSTTNSYQIKNGKDSKRILNDLMDIVKECQTRFGGKTELATENDSRVVKLCASWEQTLSYGLKQTNSSILKSVSDLVAGNVSVSDVCTNQFNQSTDTFWNFAYQHLTAHEKERFSTLRHVWTDSGKVRALIRAALNERALERYILIWLNDVNLETSYESWSLMRNNEVVNLLPSMAAGLSSILFAISVDCPELNVQKTCIKETRPEPIIAVRKPSEAPLRKIRPRQGQIITFDDANTVAAGGSSSGVGSYDSSSGSPSSALTVSSNSVPKSLSSMCLKYVEDNNDVNITKKSTPTLNDIPPPSSAPLVTTVSSNNNQSIILSHDLSPDIEHIDYSLTATEHEVTSLLETLTNEINLSKMLSTTTSKSSSTSSSMSSVNIIEDIQILKAKLREAEDRSSMLEARVAELSLENHRLRGLSNSSRHNLMYFSVSVPRVLLQKQNSNRKYYAYEVHIIPTHGGDEWTILRRYSEFYKLHKKFQKDNVAVKTLDFPPKKKFGNMEAHFVEQRRQRLQVYLRHLLAILPEVGACTTRTQLEQVFPFFK